MQRRKMYTLNIVSFNPQTHLKIKFGVKISQPPCHQNRIPVLLIFLQLLNKDYTFTTDLLKVPIHISLSQVVM